MSEPFLPEIMSFNFPPNGQLLPINQNQALFSLLGTTFGGNGQTTFALPNAHPCWQRPHTRRGAGEQSQTLSISEMPTQTHVA